MTRDYDPADLPPHDPNAPLPEPSEEDRHEEGADEFGREEELAEHDEHYEPDEHDEHYDQDDHERAAEEPGREEGEAEGGPAGRGGGGGGGRGRRGRGRGGDRGGDRGEGGDRRERRLRIDSFEKMKVWQEAHQLCLRIFAVTPNLPQEQQAGLALQMEQAAVAVPKSIAEGFKRRGPRNKAHYYNVAQTNLEGLRYYFILCRDLGYDVGYDDLAYRGDQISRMLDGLIRSMIR